MIRCVELIGEHEEETEGIYLIGGFMGAINAYSTLKATFIYPNMYLYNRRALCKISISYNDEQRISHEIETHIKFDTTLRGDIPPVEIKSFYANKFCTCDTVDEDELDNCQPVNCMMKYLGYRNFFNRKWKRCTSVPICVADPQNDEPDVSYLPQNNKCRNLNSTITEDDLNKLEQGFVNNISEKSNPINGLTFRCNNGMLDLNTGFCICNEGWTSGENDWDAYVPGLNIYHMCNIRINSWNEANMEKIRQTILAFSILGVLTAVVVIFLTISLYGLYRLLKNYKTRIPFKRMHDCNCN